MNTVRVNLSEGRWFRGTPISATAYYTTVVVTDPGTVGETLGRAVICSKERIQADTEPLCEYSCGRDAVYVTYGPCEAP